MKQQEMCRQKWVDAEERSREMSRQKDEMSEQNAKLETKLMHAKGLIDTEIRKRLKLENDNSAMVCLALHERIFFVILVIMYYEHYSPGAKMENTP